MIAYTDKKVANKKLPILYHCQSFNLSLLVNTLLFISSFFAQRVLCLLASFLLYIFVVVPMFFSISLTDYIIYQILKF